MRAIGGHRKIGGRDWPRDKWPKGGRKGDRPNIIVSELVRTGYKRVWGEVGKIWAKLGKTGWVTGAFVGPLTAQVAAPITTRVIYLPTRMSVTERTLAIVRMVCRVMVAPWGAFVVVHISEESHYCSYCSNRNLRLPGSFVTTGCFTFDNFISEMFFQSLTSNAALAVLSRLL